MLSILFFAVFIPLVIWSTLSHVKREEERRAWEAKVMEELKLLRGMSGL